LDGDERSLGPAERLTQVHALLGRLRQRIMRLQHTGLRVVAAVMPEVAGVELPVQEGVEVLGCLAEAEGGLGKVSQDGVCGPRLRQPGCSLGEAVECADTFVQLCGEPLDVLVRTVFASVHVISSVESAPAMQHSFL